MRPFPLRKLCHLFSPLYAAWNVGMLSDVVGWCTMAFTDSHYFFHVYCTLQGLDSTILD